MSQVHGQGKIPKRRTSAVIEKCQKVAGPRSRKNTKLAKVSSYAIIPKTGMSALTGKYKRMHRSAVMPKFLKLTILLSWNDTKNATCRRSTVKEKYKKVAGPRSLKYAKKLTGPWSRKNTKIA